MNVELGPGAELGDYRIESLVGRGAMGAVYVATDRRLERRLALKVLAPELARDDRFRARFLRESRLVASLEHPHIVPIYGAGEVDGVVFLAMRYVEGRDLRDLVRRLGRLEPARAVELLGQVGDALDVAHAAGLVHRDVKPANVLVTRGRGGAEHAYLCDFGLAKHASTVSSLTTERSLVGTIDYVAPEQITGGAVDGRADVYGLGCVLFECLTGAPPFARGMELAVVYAHLNDPPPSLSAARADLPEALDAVVVRALAKDPAERFATCGDLVAAASAAIGAPAGAAPAAERRVQVRTFLIGDLRGYTTFTRERGDEAAAGVAARFAELARDAAEIQGGTLVEVRGDEVLAVFDSSRDAFRAAVAIQRQAQLEGLPLGVGIGLDAGEAVPIEDGFRGAALNVAARLCAQAKAGEILATAQATHLAGPTDGIAYRPRRPLALKGIAAPVQAVDLVPEEPYVAPAAAVRATPPAKVVHRRGLLLGGVAAAVAVAGGSALALRSLQGSSGKPTHGHVVSAPLTRDAVYALDARTGRVVRSISLPDGSVPGNVAVGAGAVWVANTGSNTITRIDPRTGTAKVEGGLPGTILSVVADQRSVWAIGGADPASHSLPIYRLDPTSGAELSVLRVPRLRGHEGALPNPDVAIGGGAIWLTLVATVIDRQDLVRVPVDAGAPRRVTDASASFLGPVAFADGSAWALGKSAPDGLTGLLLRSGGTSVRPTATTAQRISAPIDLIGLAAGAGAIWFLRQDGTLWRVDPSTDALAGAPFALGAGDWSAITVAGGAVWIAGGDGGIVVRVDPATRKVTRIALHQPAARIAAGAGVVWVSAHAAAAPVGAGGRGGVLRIAGTDNGGWDGTSYWGSDWAIESVTCNGLLDHPSSRDPVRQQQLEPTIAAALPTISPDGRTYTFRIRRGLHFSDGQPLTAEDVRATYLRNLDPKAGFDVLGSSYYAAIEGYDAYEKGARTISGITVHGDDVTFRLTRADPAFVYATQLRFMCVVPRGTPHGHTPVPPPTTGPYSTETYRSGRSLVLARNPYWSANARAMGVDTRGLYNVERIEVNLNPGDGAEQLQAIAGGRLDLVAPGMLGSPPVTNADARAHPVPRRLHVPIGAIAMLYLNVRRPAFADVRLRRAVSEALDRNAIAALDPDALSQPWSSLLPGNLLGANGAAPYPLAGDAGEARRLITSVAGPKPVPLSYWFFDRDPDATFARAMAAQLNAVGFRVAMHPVQPESWPISTDARHREADLFTGGWTEDFPDAASFLGLFRRGGDGGFGTAATDRSIDRVLSLPVGPGREQAAAALADELARDDAPVAVVSQQYADVYASPRVRNLVWNAGDDAPDLAMVSLAG